MRRIFPLVFLTLAAFSYSQESHATSKSPMTFVKSGAAILASGEIVANTQKEFISFASSHNIHEGDTIYFDSFGGNVDTSLSLGRSVRAYGLNTAVARNGECASACVFTFMGGVKRIVINDNELFIHQMIVTSPDLDSATTQTALSAGIRSALVYIKEMGIANDFMTDMLTTPPTNISPVSLARANTLNLSNNGIGVIANIGATALKPRTDTGGVWRHEVNDTTGITQHGFYKGNEKQAVIGCWDGAINLLVVFPKGTSDENIRNTNWKITTDSMNWNVEVKSIEHVAGSPVITILAGKNFIRDIYSSNTFDFYADTPHTLIYGGGLRDLKNDLISCRN